MIVWGADNLLKTFLLEKGDVDSAWATAAHIVEGEYRTGAQEHLYIENQGMIAEYSAKTGVTVWGSLQCPYYVLKASASPSSICPRKRFASSRPKPAAPSAAKKTIPPSSLAMPALLAMKSGHPVKMVYDRMEDLAATTKRHPSRMRHRTALDQRRQTAGDGDRSRHRRRRIRHALVHCSLARHASLHRPLSLPQHARASHAHGRPTIVPYGAFRGFGAPQAIFAMERHMDEIARDARHRSSGSFGAETFSTTAIPTQPNN